MAGDSGNAADFLKGLTGPDPFAAAREQTSGAEDETRANRSSGIFRTDRSDAASRYDFFRLARELDRLAPERPRTGCAIRPAQEPCRFGEDPGLDFAPSAVQPAYRRADGKVKIPVRFLGLLGPDGPLPLRYTEYVRARALNFGDPTLLEFLDLFHHRMIALFYRAWAAGRAEVSSERPADDYVADVLAAFAGILPPALRQRDCVQDEAKLHFSGLLAGSVRNPQGLERIIQQYFGLTARVEEFRGGWCPIPRRYHCLLGGRQAALGETAVVGSVSWEATIRFALRLGPLRLRDYETLLPNGRGYERLRGWVNNYAGLELACDLRLELRKGEIPPVRLGEYGRLGWTSWLKNQQAEPAENPLVSFPLTQTADPEN